jgi:ferredoxin
MAGVATGSTQNYHIDYIYKLSEAFKRGVQLKIVVNKSRCTGHARCAAVAPELYELDENGYIAFAEKQVPPQLEEQAVKGSRSCPERALKIVRE